MPLRERKKQGKNNKGDEQASDYEGEASSPAEEEAELVTMASVRKMINQFNFNSIQRSFIDMRKHTFTLSKQVTKCKNKNS